MLTGRIGLANGCLSVLLYDFSKFNFINKYYYITYGRHVQKINILFLAVISITD